MSVTRSAAGLTFWLGLAVLAGAIGLFVNGLTTAPTGMEDLAAIAGAVLLATVSGLLFGVHLMLAWRAGSRRPALWRLGIATAGAALAFAGALHVGNVALGAPNWGLLLYVAAALVVTGGGLLAAGAMLRRRPASA